MIPPLSLPLLLSLPWYLRCCCHCRDTATISSTVAVAAMIPPLLLLRLWCRRCRCYDTAAVAAMVLPLSLLPLVVAAMIHDTSAATVTSTATAMILLLLLLWCCLYLFCCCCRCYDTSAAVVTAVIPPLSLLLLLSLPWYLYCCYETAAVTVD